MSKQIVSIMLSALVQVLSTEDVKKFIDAGLDAIENRVTDSENKIDDAIVLPLTRKIRVLANVPDNDTVN